MGVNQTGITVDDRLPNDMNQMRRELDDLRNKPQLIGNSSLDWVTFTPYAFGPVSVAAGATANFAITFMDSTATFTYNGRPAKKRVTEMEMTSTVFVDNHTAPFIEGIGSSLSAGQLKILKLGPNVDFYYTGTSQTNGQQYVVIRVKNEDTVAHNIYIDGTAILPRPELVRS